MCGLPEKQLSFLLPVILPTPNEPCSVEHNCKPTAFSLFLKPTHILTGCSAAVEQGSILWRHDSVYKFLSMA